MDDDISQWSYYPHTMNFTTPMIDLVPVASRTRRSNKKTNVQVCKENPKYGKFKNNDITEIFHTYSKLFGGTWDFMKYALTPTKLSQRGLDLSSNSNAEDHYDTVPINAETTNSSDKPADSRVHSSMNISLSQSGEKHKGKQSKGKGKKKRFGAREVSESVDNLATTSREFTSILRSRDKGVMTISECVKDWLSTGPIHCGDELHLFSLWWFRDNDNCIAYSASETLELRFAWVEKYFKRGKDANQAKPLRARRKL